MTVRTIAEFVAPDGWGEAWSEARAARACGVTTASLRRLVELVDAGVLALPRVRWESVRTRRGVEMVLDSQSAVRLAAFVRGKRAAVRTEDLERAIAENAASSGQIVEREGRLLFAPDDPDRLRTEHVAELLGVTTREVRALCSRGRLRATRAPRLAGTRGDLMIETASLAEFVAGRNRESARA